MGTIKSIAETAWHHEGDFTFFKNLILTICNECKCDFIKLHITLDLNEYVQTNSSLYSALIEWTLNETEWKEIIELIINNGKKPLFLVNDKAAVRFVKKYDPEIIEIHSVCLNDIHLLDAIKQNIEKKTKIMLGVGGNTLEEINHSMHYLNGYNFILMHGFQNYPTKYEDVNFAKMRNLMNTYQECEHGYADHTAWNESNNLLITLFGVAQGVKYIEKHVTTVYGEKRCDWNSAISVEMMNELIIKYNILDKCMGNGKTELNEAEKKYSVYGPMKKAAFTVKAMKNGDLLNKNNIVFKRTDIETDLSQLDIVKLIGSKVNCNLDANTLLKKDFF